MVFGYDLLRKLSISNFRGMSHVEVNDLAEKFYDEVLIHDEVEWAARILREYNEDVWIASASIEPIVKVVAQKLGVKNYIAAQLEREGEFYTGRLRDDTLGKNWDTYPVQR